MKYRSIFSLLVTALVLSLAVNSGCQKERSVADPEAGSESAATSTEGSGSVSTGDPVAEQKVVERKDRSFAFNYGAKINEVPKGAKVRVWFPVAQSSAQQEVTQTGATIPSELKTNQDSKYSNKIGFFEVESDATSPIEFAVSYQVKRDLASVENVAHGLSDTEKRNFLNANSLVPIDGKPQKQFQDLELPLESMAAGEKIYNVVEDHMKYDKSQAGYGNGDAAWACDSRTGNCTDFHSLFISLARSNSIPARFEIGFPLPADKTEGTIGGYHCWAWFFAQDAGWTPVDISEADKHPELKDFYFGKLTADRIAFSTGRDIELVPKSASGPLNFFVYPHVEVDGEVWPKDKIKLDFSFKDQ